MIHVTTGTNTFNERRRYSLFSRRCTKCRRIQKLQKNESNKTITCKNCGVQIPAKVIRR